MNRFSESFHVFSDILVNIDVESFVDLRKKRRLHVIFPAGTPLGDTSVLIKNRFDPTFDPISQYRRKQSFMRATSMMPVTTQTDFAANGSLVPKNPMLSPSRVRQNRPENQNADFRQLVLGCIKTDCSDPRFSLKNMLAVQGSQRFIESARFFSTGMDHSSEKKISRILCCCLKKGG